MATSHRELQPINVQLPSPNPSMNDIPVGLPTPSSLAVHDEQLTRTVHYTRDGKSITFEVVNKRMTLTEPDSSGKGVDPTPDSIFKRISMEFFCFCISQNAVRKGRAFKQLTPLA